VTPDFAVAARTAYQNTTGKSVQTIKQTVSPAARKDSVELSGSALAQSLKSRGFSVDQIALQMGVDVSTVSKYLKITSDSDKTTKTKSTNSEPEQTVVSASRQSFRENSLIPELKNSTFDKASGSVAGDVKLGSSFTKARQPYEEIKPDVYNVERPGSARANTLKSQGYSVAEISGRMGVDINTIKKYVHKQT
jgi:predicted transcriptional regulator